MIARQDCQAGLYWIDGGKGLVDNLMIDGVSAGGRMMGSILFLSVA